MLYMVGVFCSSGYNSQIPLPLPELYDYDCYNWLNSLC